LFSQLRGDRERKRRHENTLAIPELVSRFRTDRKTDLDVGGAEWDSREVRLFR